MKVRVRVSYPWAGIEDDIEIIEVDDAADVDAASVETANEMIWNRVGIDYEIIEEDEDEED